MIIEEACLLRRRKAGRIDICDVWRRPLPRQARALLPGHAARVPSVYDPERERCRPVFCGWRRSWSRGAGRGS